MRGRARAAAGAWPRCAGPPAVLRPANSGSLQAPLPCFELCCSADSALTKSGVPQTKTLHLRSDDHFKNMFHSTQDEGAGFLPGLTKAFTSLDPSTPLSTVAFADACEKVMPIFDHIGAPAAAAGSVAPGQPPRALLPLRPTHPPKILLQAPCS